MSNPGLPRVTLGATTTTTEARTMTTTTTFKPLTSTGYDGRRWRLIDPVTQQSIHQGERRASRGETWVIQGGSAPHKPGSTGRVVVAQGQHSRELFPSVVGATWVRD